MVKGIANQIEYVFNSNAIKEAFEGCINVIKREINMNKLVEMNRICIISDKKVEEIEEGDWEDKILVETNNLKDDIEFFIEEFSIDARSLFLEDNDISERLDEIITRIKEGDRNTQSFSIHLEKSSDLETLFNVLYAREIKLEEREVQYDEFENVVIYGDFEYTDIFDAIDNLCEKCDQFESFEFDHSGGEPIDNIEHLDLYYKFKLKKPNN